MARQVFIYCTDCTKVVEKYSCEHQFTSSSGRSAAPLAVVFEGPNGEIQVPGKAVDRLPKRLQKLGYTLRTIQDSRQYSDFCKRMDKDAKKKHEAYMEALHSRYEARQREERAEIRAQLQTQFGKDFYEAAVEAAERARYKGNYDAGSHIEGFEYDSRHGGD
jgi:hypothetical protein